MAACETPPNFRIKLAARIGNNHAIRRVPLNTTLEAVERTLLVNSSAG